VTVWSILEVGSENITIVANISVVSVNHNNEKLVPSQYRPARFLLSFKKIEFIS
jgi:hypothetical protein